MPNDYGEESFEGYYTGSTECCGLDELVGTEFGDGFKPQDALTYVSNCAQHRDGGSFAYCVPNKPAHIFFTDIDKLKYKNGLRLAAYIRKYRLGAVYASKAAHNKNSGNYLRMWMWTPNWTKIAKHKIKKKK